MSNQYNTQTVSVTTTGSDVLVFTASASTTLLKNISWYGGTTSSVQLSLKKYGGSIVEIASVSAAASTSTALFSDVIALEANDELYVQTNNSGSVVIISVESTTSVGGQSIDVLNDVDTTGKASGHILTWDGTDSAWVSTAFSTPFANGIASITSDDIANGSTTVIMTTAERAKLSGIEAGAEVNVQANWTEVSTSSDAYIQNKPTLATVATTGAYTDLSGTPTLATVATTGAYSDLSGKPTIPADLTDLGDTPVGYGTAGQVLATNSTADGTEWITPSSGGATAIDDLSDVSILNATTGEFLKYDGADWTNDNVTLNEINDVNITSVADGQVLTYDSTTSKWINETPSGGGSGGLGTADQTLTADRTIITNTYDLDVQMTSGDFVKFHDGTNDLLKIDTTTTGNIFSVTNTSGLTKFAVNSNGLITQGGGFPMNLVMITSTANYASADQRFFPVGTNESPQTAIDTASNYPAHFCAPFNGKLMRIVCEFGLSDPGQTVVGFHKASHAGSFSTTASATSTVTPSWTSPFTTGTVFDFSSASTDFSAGDILAFSFDATNTTYYVTATFVFAIDMSNNY